MTTNNNWKSILGVAALAVSLAGTAWAHGPSRGDGGRPSPPAPMPSSMRPAGPHARGLLAQLLYPCQTDCFAADRTCDEAADSAALTCVTGACSTEIQTAQTACATTGTATACNTAFTALQTCATTCLDTRQTALTACRTAGKTCRDACSVQ